MSTPVAATGGSSSVQHSMFDHPLACLLIGLLIVLPFALLGVSSQVATSEAMGGISTSLQDIAHFKVFTQLADIWNGHYTNFQFFVYVYSWGVQVIQFVLSIGIEWPKHNKAFARIFLWGGISTVVLNSVADFIYFSHQGLLAQVGWTLVSFMLSFGLLHVALFLIIRKGVIAWVRGY